MTEAPLCLLYDSRSDSPGFLECVLYVPARVHKCVVMRVCACVCVCVCMRVCVYVCVRAGMWSTKHVTWKL